MSLPALSVTPPRVWKGMKLPTQHVLDAVQRVADRHYEEGGGEEGELSTGFYPICAKDGAVYPHVDQFGGEETGKLIYGLVLRSDDHVLHSEAMQGGGVPLEAGDLYALHPLDRHWTTCPGGGQIIFAAAFLGPDDNRFDRAEKIAHDLRWETMNAALEAERWEEQQRVQERAMYRGVEAHDRATR